MPDAITDKIHQQFSLYPKRKYPKGQILVFADESPGHVFYLVKGKVIKYDISYRGDEVIVNIFKPSAFFPMSWAINNSPNEYFYKTVEDTELHVVPSEDAVAFLKENPDVMFDLLSRVYRGTDGMIARMVQLMSGSAKSRLLNELLIEARRFGAKQPDGSYKLQVNEQGIAARAGLTRETVNREMKKLKTSNLVNVESNCIVINDLESLEAAFKKS